ncbi:hypothetical protein BEL04_03030 [Mucilaginibacter sp. PPCGB 2223]|uniref:T9SS type B sorting domain-containing protein n=1 Tax=Mucilaginibacter sp. PPCGB 2223 TaxID=1886027 RepID=UPI000824446E|nr:gliding motility-associated C-terminal domain-containing protein [Mucilaginibacter sp. PPCGB 2223]OCX53295.1 hypothetical protein BEL04_03030 [Mucilaginibacter sp. PPCGB 2223]
MITPRYYILGLLILLVSIANAQCPENIGFDYGNFKDWQGAKGIASTSDGSLVFNQTGIFSDIHTLFYAKDNQVDPYGHFPIVSPNGSSTCVRLGNNTTGTNKAQQLSYTFTVPANDPDYSIIYYYAVVFQNPSHAPYQQPRFTAKVFDVTDNQYITCGNFDFVASSGLPGFQNAGNSVYYKDWSPVTINLLGFSGKTLRLEFATNNCTLGGHFGYAYIDINQNCTSPISGSTFCTTTASKVTLVAPSGFAQYFWYKGNDFSTVIGQASTLDLDPAPAIGSTYSVRIVPFPGIGCEDTIHTTIKGVESIVFKVKDTISTCSSNGIDLTDTSVTSGSSPGFTYTYFSDAACTKGIVGPQSILTSGVYYIKATTPGGCSFVKQVNAYVFNQSSLVVNNPAPACKSQPVDITLPDVTRGSDPGLVFTYWTDIGATKKLSNPDKITTTGVYYIKATSGICSVVSPVSVTVVDPPNLVINNPAGCLTVDMTLPAVTAGSDAGITLSYWTDAAATQAVTDPHNITSSNTYYIKAVNSTGCATIAPVLVDVKPVPVVTITNPPAVVFPETVDLSTTFTPQSGLTYSYWHDAAATIPLTNATAIARPSTYYIKVSNTGCSTIYPVKVTIGAPPAIDFSLNTFTPNGDGVNDIFKIKAPASIKLKYFKIYSPWGQQLFETADLNKGWDGTYQGKPMPMGTYYWIYNAYDTYTNLPLSQSGSITIIR